MTDADPAGGFPFTRPEMGELLDGLVRDGHPVWIRVNGRSMAPFLRGGETVTIVPVNATRLRRGDLVAFRDEAGGPTIHRVVLMRRPAGGRAQLRTKGDALSSLDPPLVPERLIGRVTRIEWARRTADLGSGFWRVVNVLAAWIGLARTCAVAACKRVNLRPRSSGTSPVP